MKRVHRIVSAVFLVGLMAAALILYEYQQRSDDPRTATPLERTMKSDTLAKSPLCTILLTGFEPFAGSPENASWEGASMLDGRWIAGCRIVAIQLPVVWGKPLQVLDSEISNYKPLAVFSFGQAPGNRFTIETYARNKRGVMPDNDVKMPGGLTDPNGAEFYKSSNDAVDRLMQTVALNYPLSVSVNAGNYLCEECLYSLEHLCATKYPHLKVMFCHVPTLGMSTEAGITITPKYISEFMEALITECMRNVEPIPYTQKH